MEVFAISGPKGGSGRSLVTATLAVRASADGATAMIDMDASQGTLTDWWALRRERKNLFLSDEPGTLDSVVDGMRGDGLWEHVFIDGPPHDQDLVEMCVLVATAVIIPIKLAYLDTQAIESVVGMCNARAKPWAFLVNEYDERKSFLNSNNIALAALADLYGEDRILKHRISYDARYRVGQIDGRTGPELSEKLADEIDDVWSDVKAVAKPIRKGVRRRG